MLVAPGPIDVVHARNRRRRLAFAKATIAHAGQRFTDRGDVAVAEDREHARDQGGVLAVYDGLLCDEIAHQRLAHRESHGLAHVQPAAWLRPECRAFR